MAAGTVRTLSIVTALAAAATTAPAADAQVPVPPAEEQIAAAVLPLPESLRAGATVRGFDAKLARVTLRQGTNTMVCNGDRPGDTIFDVRCYERQFQAVIDRRRELVGSGALNDLDPRFEDEIKSGRLALPDYPTAGYRMLGPIEAYDPRSRTWTAAIERWQSVHFPYQTAAAIGLPTEREGTTPYVMASGTWWSHVMIQHTPPREDGSTVAAAPARLGSLTFATSGKPAAQPDFIRGVLYLHSFEYDDAARAFQAAQRADPDFAMAYWGEALTYTHPIWNQQDFPAARAVLSRLAPTAEARAAKATTSRERAWLGAVEVLYGEGSKTRRDTLYARAMERLAADYPDDEATLFLALAIMGLNQGVRDVPAYMRAGALALEVLERQPDHPGAAHYVIHAFDDPTHARLGLRAARAYSGIAPGAAHAQHMTTHIFLAMGMWPEVISQNTAAAGPDRSRWQPGHYTYWLHYGLLQAGRIEEAATLLDELRAHAGPSPSAQRRWHLHAAAAQQVMTGERWTDPVLGWSLAPDDLGPNGQAIPLFASGFAALNRGDRSAAAAALEQLAKLPAGTGLAATPGLLASELRAGLMRADGRKAEAEQLLTEVATAAAALPAEFGPPDFVKPPWELLGEWLLADGRVAEARQAFTRALGLTPGRLLSRRGLSQAEQRLTGSGGGRP
jgi:tetratricopeptide (TPR) repeat protein